MEAMARIAIVGGGVIGCAAAERLTRDGHSVTILERDQAGAHASGAAAGLLAPFSEGEDLGHRSLQLFPELVERIERESGVEVEFRAGESITPALDAAEERALRSLGAGRWLSAREAQAEEPGLNPRLRGALVLPESQVTPPRLVRALVRTAVLRGADLREGTPVSKLLLRGGRVIGVQTLDGPLRADFVVLAAGPWSAELAAAAVPLDVRPSRGQLVQLQPRGRPLRRMLTWRGSYLVPKPDGTIVAGSTEEEAGFDARPTVEGVAGLLEFARRVVPELAAATVAGVWAALRPATPDGRPVVGPVPDHPGLVVATGHNRNGILLAPITAEMVAGAIAS